MTNKRKDAAALFELLDNSSLRVPKNAGSLKIPDWWKSKENPSPARIDTTLEEGGVAVLESAPRRPLVKTVSAKAPASAAADEPRRRLFEPPPVGQGAGAAPSIRPPGIAAPAASTEPGIAAQSTGESAASATASPAPVAVPRMAAAPFVEESVAPRDPRIFTAQTYAQKRRQWVTPQPGAFARLPKWVLPAGLGVIVLLISGTMFAAHHRDNKAGAAVTPHPTAADAARAAAINVPASGVASPYAPIAVPKGDKPGRVFEPGKIARTPDAYYIIIARSPSKAAAEKSAQFLADHGIDVSVEVDVSTGLNILISVQGFPSTTAAIPYKNRIIEIGHLTAEYKKSGRAWDDPAVLNGIRTVAQ